jgi:CRP-like cAMP-binding protein
MLGKKMKERWGKTRNLLSLAAGLRRAAPDSCATFSYQALRELFKTEDDKVLLAKKMKVAVPDFLPTVPVENYVAVCRDVELVRYEPCEIVVSLGDIPDAWYFIVSGSLDIYMNDEDALKKERKLSSLSFGASFGELAFLNNAKRRTATVVSGITRSVVLKVRKFKYVKYVMALHKDKQKVLERQDILDACPMLKNMGRGNLLKIAYTLREHSYPPFTVIREQGDMADCIFIVVSGLIKLMHRFYGNASSIELASLGPTRLVGLVDFVKSGALETGEHPKHRCALVTGGETTKVLKLSSLTFENVLMEEMGSEIEEIARIRKSWEVMRIKNALSHPDISVGVTDSMLESYGYIGVGSLDALRPSRSLTEDNHFENRFYDIVNEARGLHREANAMLVQSSRNCLSEGAARKLRHAYNIYTSAAKMALSNNRARQANVVNGIANACIAPVHRHTYYSELNRVGRTTSAKQLSGLLSSSIGNVSQLIRTESKCRDAIKFWNKMKQFAFYHHLSEEHERCNETIKTMLRLTRSCIRENSLAQRTPLRLERKSRSYVRRSSINKIDTHGGQDSSLRNFENSQFRGAKQEPSSLNYDLGCNVKKEHSTLRKSLDTASVLNVKNRKS